VKFPRAQTHRVAQRVPGWRVPSSLITNDLFCRFCKRVCALQPLQRLYVLSLVNSPYFFSGSQKLLTGLTHHFTHFYLLYHQRFQWTCFDVHRIYSWKDKQHFKLHHIYCWIYITFFMKYYEITNAPAQCMVNTFRYDIVNWYDH
jgi:hypothetical protein